jgi:hypothetical protein
MARARRVSLFEREIRVRLSSAALEILFQLGSVLSEGQVEGERYFGSTMITIDLATAVGLTSDPCDLATARRVTDLLAGDERVRDRARRIAAAEARRIAAGDLIDPQIDVRVHGSGSHIQLDLDVEAAVVGAQLTDQEVP